MERDQGPEYQEIPAAPESVPGIPRSAHEAAARVTAEVVQVDAGPSREDILAGLTPIDQLEPSETHPERIIEVIKRLDAYIAQSKADPDHSVLYPTQVPPFEDLLTELRIHGRNLRGYFSIPTGVGKMVMLAEFAKLTGLKTVASTPSLHLLTKTAKTFKVLGEPVEVGVVYGNKKQLGKRITVTSNASLTKHAEDDPDIYERESVGLLLLDEAHDALAPKMRQVVGRAFPNAITIGFTATDKYSEHKKLEDLLPTEIHRMTLKEAHALKLIAPLSNWVVKTGIHLPQINLSGDDYDMRMMNSAINLPERNLLVARVYLHKFAGKKAVIFCAGVEHAQAMAAIFNAMGVAADTIHGEQALGHQELLLQRFSRTGQNSLDVLCNDKIIGQGTDIPAVVCLNAVPTYSMLREAQRGGRVSRLDAEDPDKRGYVVDFVDDNLPRAPVLYADPEIANSAHFGPRPTEAIADEAIRVPGGSGVLITDPDHVEELAWSYAELRDAGRLPRAPEGWQRSTEIAEEMGVPTARMFNALARVRQKYPALIEREADRYSGRKTRVTGMHYSPVIQEFLRDHRAELVDLDRTRPPKHWLSAPHVGAIYNVSVSGARRDLAAIAQDDPERMIECRMSSAGSQKGKFYSPEVIQQYTAARGLEYLPPGQAPPRWYSRRTVSTEYPARAIGEAAYFFRKHYPTAASGQILEVGDDVYWSPKFMERILKHIELPNRWQWLREVATPFGLSENELDRFLLASFHTELKGKLAYHRRFCVEDGRLGVGVDRALVTPLTERLEAALALHRRNPDVPIPGLTPPRR
jgi:superfamily II DNA or RNA helicase